MGRARVVASVELSQRRALRPCARAGIAAHFVAHIFERYWQAPLPLSRQGSGLGLFIAKGLVEAHGGALKRNEATACARCSTPQVKGLLEDGLNEVALGIS